MNYPELDNKGAYISAGVGALIIIAVIVYGVLSASCAKLPPMEVTKYSGNKPVPHVEIKDHSIKLLGDCTSNLCDISTYANLSLHNPLDVPIRMKPFCEYKVGDGPDMAEPYDKGWITLRPTSSVTNVHIDAMIGALLMGPTDVTIQCGARWKKTQ